VKTIMKTKKAEKSEIWQSGDLNDWDPWLSGLASQQVWHNNIN